MIFSGAGFVWYGGLIGGIVASLPRLAPLQDPLAGAAGHVRSGAGDRPGRRPYRMPAVGRRRLGHGLHAAVGDGVSEGDRRMDGPHRADARAAATNWCRRPDAPRPDARWVRVHPTPIYETILYTGVFLVLWSIRKQARVDGQLLLPVPDAGRSRRFLVEFMRVNPRVMLGLSRSAADRHRRWLLSGRMAYSWSSFTALPTIGGESGGLSRHRDAEQDPVGRRSAAGSGRDWLCFSCVAQLAVAPGRGHHRRRGPGRRRRRRRRFQAGESLPAGRCRSRRCAARWYFSTCGRPGAGRAARRCRRWRRCTTTSRTARIS